MNLHQTIAQEQEPQVRQLLEVRQMIHHERELVRQIDPLLDELQRTRRGIRLRLKHMHCRRVPWTRHYMRQTLHSLCVVLVLALVGCSAVVPESNHKPIQTASALMPAPTTTTASGLSRVLPAPVYKTNIALAWTNPNTTSDVRYMLTEFHSTTNLLQPFSFKCYVAAGITNVTFKITNASEFFICRFAQTNVTPWVVSDWNTK